MASKLVNLSGLLPESLVRTGARSSAKSGNMYPHQSCVVSSRFSLPGNRNMSLFSKCVSRCAPVWQAALLSLLLIGSIVQTAQAQSTDITAPVLLLDEIESGVSGETQVFSARVSDDVALKSVTLFHRLSGDEAFVASPMRQVGSSDVFAVSLSSDIDDIRDIEYYLQAEDTGGNKSLNGFAFDPLIRDMSIESRPAVVPVSKVRRSLTRNQRLLFGVLGVLVIGAVASQAGGGGGSSSSDSPDTIPVNITVNPL